MRRPALRGSGGTARFDTIFALSFAFTQVTMLFALVFLAGGGLPILYPAWQVIFRGSRPGGGL